jgi:hypothetical protein
MIIVPFTDTRPVTVVGGTPVCVALNVTLLLAGTSKSPMVFGSSVVVIEASVVDVASPVVIDGHALPAGTLIDAEHASFSPMHAVPQNRHRPAVQRWQSLPIWPHDNVGVGGGGVLKRPDGVGVVRLPPFDVVVVEVVTVVDVDVVGLGVGPPTDGIGVTADIGVGIGVGAGLGDGVGHTAVTLLHTAVNSHLPPHHAHALAILQRSQVSSKSQRVGTGVGGAGVGAGDGLGVGLGVGDGVGAKVEPGGNGVGNGVGGSGVG